MLPKSVQYEIIGLLINTGNASHSYLPFKLVPFMSALKQYNLVMPKKTQCTMVTGFLISLQGASLPYLSLKPVL